MKQKITNKDHEKNNLFQTADLSLAATLSLFHPLEAIEKVQTSRRAVFYFKRTGDLNEFIERYWRGEMRVEPQAYFNQLRNIKTRLYGGG